MKEDLLIVDAYNMIGNWPHLNKLKQADRLEDARDELLAELSEYKKYRDINMIVVFDAMYVPGNAKSFLKFDMEIVWTSKDQTADSYIEALSRKKQNRFTQVIVATSDQAEQWTIFSAGALRIPARELLSNIRRAKQEVNAEARKMTDKSAVIRHTPWDSKQMLELEKLRDKLTHDGK
ncbi:NYN domain-containing protein [Lentilactobacillus diolivorans]|uniref:YacP-like NYN domain-containing protein n=1 Tax=Lentilactobacillus diolivorans TaxID=179838 RepID=UPI0024684944|nr:NYN domain-containing protein [Lentilactobacillus diolivorans]MDH5105755.1 NYN domain-containing protein [Lentilactobacillus diolivorans]